MKTRRKRNFVFARAFVVTTSYISHSLRRYSHLHASLSAFSPGVFEKRPKRKLYCVENKNSLNIRAARSVTFENFFGRETTTCMCDARERGPSRYINVARRQARGGPRKHPRNPETRPCFCERSSFAGVFARRETNGMQPRRRSASLIASRGICTRHPPFRPSVRPPVPTPELASKARLISFKATVLKVLSAISFSPFFLRVADAS